MEETPKLVSPSVVTEASSQARILVEERKKHFKLARSTYTQKVAITFQAYYDLAIEKRENLLIPLKYFEGNNLTTLYKKVCDGLLFLQNRLEKFEDAWKYYQLRQQITVVRVDKPEVGILLRFNAMSQFRAQETAELAGEQRSLEQQATEARPAIAVPMEKIEVPVQPTAEMLYTKLLDRVTQYVNYGTGMLVINDLNLTDVQRNQITNMANDAGIAGEVTANKIKMFKV